MNITQTHGKSNLIIVSITFLLKKTASFKDVEVKFHSGLLIFMACSWYKII